MTAEHRRLKVLDFILLAVLAGGAVSPWFIGEDSGAYAVISHDGGEERLPLAEERTLTVDGPVGRTVIVIEDGTVRIRESDCPQKLCVRLGAVDRAGESLVCVPNRVVVTVEGGADERPAGIDAVTR
jgi:hypothetical protein